MKITRTNPLTSTTLTLDLAVTPAQYAAWEGGALAQDAFPGLDADGREFIISGIAPGEWDNMFPEE